MPYRTATVTPSWLGTPPVNNTTGAAPVRPLGTTTVTCTTPACPGAGPAERISAFTPPIVTWKLEGAADPSPVANSVNNDPPGRRSVSRVARPVLIERRRLPAARTVRREYAGRR